MFLTSGHKVRSLKLHRIAVDISQRGHLEFKKERSPILLRKQASSGRHLLRLRKSEKNGRKIEQKIRASLAATKKSLKLYICKSNVIFGWNSYILESLFLSIKSFCESHLQTELYVDRTKLITTKIVGSIQLLLHYILTY